MNNPEKNPLPNLQFMLEGRILCEDGNCIGVIGPYKKCKVCKKPYTGNESIPASDVSDISDVPNAKDSISADESQKNKPFFNIKEKDESDKQDDFSISDRKCCPDEACIGIIGENEKCGTCGKPAR